MNHFDRIMICSNAWYAVTYRVDINLHTGEVFYKVYLGNRIWENQDSYFLISRQQAERLIKGLSEIDILSWQDSYGWEKDRCIDGFCWEIQLFMGELPVRRMKGINCKPEHFDELIFMVEQTVSRDFGTKRPEFL